MLLKLVPRQLNGTSRSCCLVHIGRRADYIELTALLSLIASLPHDGLKMSLWQDDCYNSGNLCKIVKYWKRLPKSKRPSSKSYERLKNGVENELTPAQLEVFCFVANILKPIFCSSSYISQRGDAKMPERTYGASCQGRCDFPRRSRPQLGILL